MCAEECCDKVLLCCPAATRGIAPHRLCILESSVASSPPSFMLTTVHPQLDDVAFQTHAGAEDHNCSGLTPTSDCPFTFWRTTGDPEPGWSTIMRTPCCAPPPSYPYCFCILCSIITTTVLNIGYLGTAISNGAIIILNYIYIYREREREARGMERESVCV